MALSNTDVEMAQVEESDPSPKPEQDPTIAEILEEVVSKSPRSEHPDEPVAVREATEQIAQMRDAVVQDEARQADAPSKPDWAVAETGSAAEMRDISHEQNEENADCCTTRVWSAYFEFFLRHPYSRLFNALVVIVANFMLYAEDPMAHSWGPCKLPGLGHAFNLLFAQWPDKGGLVCLKLLCSAVGLVFGMWAGKKLVHDKCLRECMKCQAFGYPKKLHSNSELSDAEKGQLQVLPDGTVLRPQLPGERDKGSWFIMLLSTFFSVVLASGIYNGLVADDTSAPQISGQLPMTNETFYKIAASGMWIATSVTFIFVFDMMAQDMRNYPTTMVCLRTTWTKAYGGSLRIHATWLTLFSLSLVVIMTIAFNPSDWWDHAMEAIDGTNEVGRCAFASFITILDLLVILQDWEFPAFKTPNHIKMPGLRIANLKCPKCNILLTGKWFNYSLMFFVLLIDIMMLKNNVFYHPEDTSQYTDPDGYIWTVNNPTDDVQYYWDERMGCCGDFKVAARFTDEPMAHKVGALFPCFIVFAAMVCMIKRSVRKNKERLEGRLSGRVLPPYNVPGRRMSPEEQRATYDTKESTTDEAQIESEDDESETTEGGLSGADSLAHTNFTPVENPDATPNATPHSPSSKKDADVINM